MTTLTDDNIKHAVDEWLAEPIGESATYGNDIGEWDVAGVTNMLDLFKYGRSKYNAIGDEAAGTLEASGFNEDLSSWNTSQVTDFREMFNGCTAFNNGANGNSGNNPLTWDTGDAVYMRGMFRNCVNFNQTLRDASGYGDWDVSKLGTGTDEVKFASNGMFDGCSKFNNGGINSSDGEPLTWSVGKVGDFGKMFSGCTAFNNGATDNSGNKPLTWDTGNALYMHHMFLDCVNFNQTLRDASGYGDWDTSNVGTGPVWGVAYTFRGMFRGCSKFNNGATDNSNSNPLILDTSAVTDMSYMFAQAEHFNQDIGDWDTSKVTNMSNMLREAYKFNQNIREWDTTDVTNYTDMFTGTGVNDGGYLNDGFMKVMSGYEGWNPEVFTNTVWESRTPKESFFNQLSENICFLGDTKVQTDQGEIRFDELTTENTIDGQKIKQVVKVINSDDTMIYIKKHAFAKQIPSQNTYISRNHGVYLDDSFIQEKDLEPQVHELIYHIAGKNLVRARNLIKMGMVTEVKREKKDTLYNVLLETHSTMSVNNILCETLNPNDPSVDKFIK